MKLCHICHFARFSPDSTGKVKLQTFVLFYKNHNPVVGFCKILCRFNTHLYSTLSVHLILLQSALYQLQSHITSSAHSQQSAESSHKNQLSTDMDPLSSLLDSLNQVAASEQVAPQRKTNAPSELVAPECTTSAPSELVAPERTISAPVHLTKLPSKSTVTTNRCHQHPRGRSTPTMERHRAVLRAEPQPDVQVHPELQLQGNGHPPPSHSPPVL